MTTTSLNIKPMKYSTDILQHLRQQSYRFIWQVKIVLEKQISATNVNFTNDDNYCGKTSFVCALKHDIGPKKPGITNWT